MAISRTAIPGSLALCALFSGCSPSPDAAQPKADDSAFESESTEQGDIQVETLEQGDALTDDAPACPPEKGALSTCLLPRFSPEYYVAEALKYFDTLDAEADRSSVPRYSTLVARWEWPPWLKLTGIGRNMMTYIDELLIVITPSTVPLRDCRAFSTQPFARCRVSFDYDGRLCPIYEEFTFNDEGEMTFIEAWSDLPGLLPTADEGDEWAEDPEVHRLSTKLPGLGDAQGLLSLNSPWMRRAAEEDPEIADFLTRAKRFWPTWLKEYWSAGSDLFDRGCGW
ncbi:MAG: hypothetical protein MUC50_10380 [Myxococcota bacterium]|jgi:hypothetical protein|nr:hypothetical protein [Myxococcota bacterium]